MEQVSSKQTHVLAAAAAAYTSSGNKRMVCNTSRDVGHFAKDCPQRTMRSKI